MTRGSQVTEPAAAPPHKPSQKNPAGVAGRGDSAGSETPPTRALGRDWLRQIEAALREQRRELETQLRSEAQAFSSTESEGSADSGSDEEAEAGTATFEREKHLSLAHNVQDLLEKNARALGKLTRGNYGICESCGDPIPLERLKALPHALMCIECKKAQERR